MTKRILSAMGVGAVGVLWGLAPGCRTAPDPPNILWLMTDEQRTDSIGCYGSPWAQTPEMDRLGSEGVIFENAITNAPVCIPARASILTGRYPNKIPRMYNVGRNSTIPMEYLTEVFHRAGYQSASFGKSHYAGTPQAFQTEVSFELSELVHYFRYKEPYKAGDYGVLQYPREPFPWIFGGRFPGRPEETAEARAVRLAIDWMEARDTGKPFLLRVSFNAPHTPVVPPEPYDTLIDRETIQLPAEADGTPEGEPVWVAEWGRRTSDARRLSAEQIAEMRRYYYGQVAFLDSQIGALLDWMGEREVLENTVVVLVSDHGNHVGDYGLVQKQTFYEPVVKVPYIFWYPEVLAAGQRVKTPVETRTLLPTLIELAGLSVPESPDDARWSLAAALEAGVEPEPRPVFSEFTLGYFAPDHIEDPLVMVRQGDWKLSLSFTPDPGDGALYNLAEDPWERHNLYGFPEHLEVQQQLTALIVDHMK